MARFPTSRLLPVAFLTKRACEYESWCQMDMFRGKLLVEEAIYVSLTEKVPEQTPGPNQADDVPGWVSLSAA